MATVDGFDTLMRSVRSDLYSIGRVQIACSSELLTQLLVLDLLYAVNQPDRPNWAPDKIILVVTRPKDLAPWLGFAAHIDICQTALLPYFSLWGNDRFINPSLTRRQRIYSLAQLSQKGSSTFIVTTPMALGQFTLSQRLFLESAIKLSISAEFDQELFVSLLQDLGYARVQVVEEESTFVVRGGIVDVWSPSELEPVRIEFVGDVVSSIRCFSAHDQKSLRSIDSTHITSAYDCLLSASTRSEDVQKLFNLLIDQQIKSSDRDGMMKALEIGVRFSGFDMFSPLFRPESDSTIDFLDDQSVMIFPSGIESCMASYNDFFVSMREAHAQDRLKGRASLEISNHFMEPEELRRRLIRKRHVELGNPYSALESRSYSFKNSFLKKESLPTNLPVSELFENWVRVFEEIVVKNNGTVAILAHHDEYLERVRALFEHRDFRIHVVPKIWTSITKQKLPAGTIVLGKGDLVSHAWIEERNLLIVPDVALFSARPRRAKPASAKLHNYLSSFAELKVSDLVVHLQHGIGRYQGMTAIVVNGISNDFLIIEYAGGDKIYLPVDRLTLLQRYSGGTDGSDQALDKLGGPGWERRKSRVKNAIKDMAEQLLKVQATRSLTRGYTYSAPDEIFVQFLAMFPYEETDDQLRAISDVDADLRSGKPMDRLVCGDVGFGKTEVALRATMRTVLEGLQAIILVPTTVLCHQHYRTFSERLGSLGVKVAQINRFVKPQEMKAAIEGIRAGTVDVLIGTHRLLSKDINPRRLGLLVIDEEQRFGVVHKERLKQLRADAHVLTLTATPIPRTLHMAMIGLRDISIIATPPQDRLSVRTFIARFDDNLIKEVIEVEIARGGQVFFVHNRVEDIEEIRRLLSSLVPHLDIRVAHGKMREQDLEEVIVDFIEQKFHVLICTTIIESGIDMPNVNTLIVNRADQFGLAQLYQLRGRVGRSTIQAYAYFLTPPEDRLSDEARERLSILAAYQELGAGFQIASHDLELRGSGNLLGGEQSGYAAAVGLELYTEMLESTIKELSGSIVEERFDPEIKIPVSAMIPGSFLPNENHRLAMYKNIFAAESSCDLRAVLTETEDRFGKLPIELKLLFKVARLKQILRAIRCVRLTANKGFCELKFLQLKELQIERLIAAVRRKPEKYRLTPDYRLLLSLDFRQSLDLSRQERMVEELTEHLIPLIDESLLS